MGRPYFSSLSYNYSFIVGVNYSSFCLSVIISKSFLQSLGYSYSSLLSQCYH
uniref:Uncharacterized protein n=1 Tax=Rhizophora mucronata TaxID=61149 RepID=A0A2P2PGD4_RHIMU